MRTLILCLVLLAGSGVLAGCASRDRYWDDLRDEPVSLQGPS